MRIGHAFDSVWATPELSAGIGARGEQFFGTPQAARVYAIVGVCRAAGIAILEPQLVHAWWDVLCGVGAAVT